MHDDLQVGVDPGATVRGPTRCFKKNHLKTRIMKPRRKHAKTIRRLLLLQIFFCLWLGGCQGSYMAGADMVSLDDQQMSAVNGQALLSADRLVAGAGAPAVDAGLTFYRMSMDATVALNANINHLQLGCGGINNYIVVGCDLDLQYVSFMGTDGAGGPGAAMTSDFVMTRPYVELAVKNDGTPNREVVGFNLGSQGARGYLSVGRAYDNGRVNQENGGTCNTSNPVTCHSGINTISGYLNAHFQGSIPVTINIWPYSETDTATIDSTIAVSGTRLSTLHVPGLQLGISGGLAGLIGSAYANLTESLRFLHGFAISDDSGNATKNFAISFERQQVAYPTYDKTGYGSPANTGWWMNVPSAQLTGIQGAPVTFTGLGPLLSALGEPGYPVSNIELNQVPTQNCYGAAKFC
jgi:hypothetical protein